MEVYEPNWRYVRTWLIGLVFSLPMLFFGMVLVVVCSHDPSRYLLLPLAFILLILGAIIIMFLVFLYSKQIVVEKGKIVCKTLGRRICIDIGHICKITAFFPTPSIVWYGGNKKTAITIYIIRDRDNFFKFIWISSCIENYKELIDDIRAKLDELDDIAYQYKEVYSNLFRSNL